MRAKILIGVAGLLLVAGIAFWIFRPTADKSSNTNTVSPVSQSKDTNEDLSDEAAAALSQIEGEASTGAAPNTSNGTAATSIKPFQYTPKPLTAEEQAAVDRIESKLSSEQLALRESQRLSQCETIKTNYPIYANQAVSKHNTRVDSINSSWSSRGAYHFGGRQAEIDQENARYEAEIAALETDTTNKLVALNCS